MPVWPDPSTNNTNALDSVLDKPALALPMLYDSAVATQAIIAARGVADGIASLGPDGKVPAGQIASLSGYLSTALNALGALTPAANKLPYFTSGSVAALADITAFARTLLASADAATAHSALGLLGIAAKVDALITGADITPSTADDGQLLQSLMILSQRSNRIINSQFSYNTSQTADIAAGTSGSLYVSDQWRMQSVGTTYAVTRPYFTRGQTDVPGSPSTYLEVINTSVTGAGNYCLISQPIEDVSILGGRTVTVSFWAKAATSTMVCVTLRQYFSSGGSSPVEGIGKTKVTIGTTWAQYGVTIDVDSVAGKTGGSSSTTYTDLQIWLDAGINFNAITDSLGHHSTTLHITNVTLALGVTSISPDVRTDFGELMLIRRYFEVGGSRKQNDGVKGGSLVAVQGVGAVTSAYAQNVRFMESKRAAPTIVLFNPSAYNGDVRNISIGADCSSSATPYISAGGFILTYTTASGSAVGNANAVNWTADARFTT